ncbi:phosphatidate cytidylyltransferase [Arcobacter sp. FWKO B]|uniref:phosphatidate cytidylyltransferase n=1 Tax=Arcobacter sp. FWKO B TaxID=2593672 RepID=UPI0018A40409|nr:CDP-archaeol synthase [Arcobacter sp. FWKO B]QOG12131.1 CDP-archaeol synthase [Arcobacter sp. FWKO B]
MWELLKSSSLRIKTALVMLIVVAIVGVINSPFVIWAMIGILMVIGLKEMMALINTQKKSLYAYSIGIWLCAYFYPNPIDLVFIVFLLFGAKLAYTKEFDKQNIAPLLYPLVPFLFILSLYYEFGILALLWLLAVVAGTDIGAYFVGKSIGKTKFSETSPNKTIEGVIGGVIIGTVFGVLFSFLGFSLVSVLVVSFFVSIASVFGDLFESYLKREANVKDSGDIFPGHGGVLDRLDGYLFGAVVMVVLLRLISWSF